jgi:hypothetical protein
MAIAALVLGILCFLPGMGILAMILGGAAVLLISRARGRLTGMGIAVTGCVLGLVGTVFWGLAAFAAVGISQGFSAMLAPTRTAITALEAGDYKTARSGFSPTLNAAVTDEDLAAFVKAYQADVGSYKSSPESLVDYIRAWIVLGGQMGKAQQQFNSSSNQVFPLPSEFDKGWALFLVELPRGAKPSSGPGGGGMSSIFQLENLGVWTLSGTEAWLIPPKTRIIIQPPPPAPSPASPGEPSQPTAPADPAAPTPPGAPAKPDSTP